MGCMGFLAELAWLGQTKLPQSLWACLDEQLGTQIESSIRVGDRTDSSLNSRCEPVARESQGELDSVVEPSRSNGNSSWSSGRWFRRLNM